jgi:hypothetical protein
LVLIFALLAWSAFDYSARMMCHKQAINAYKESPEYKIRLKRFKEEKVLEMEKKGLIKKKMNGKRCGSGLTEFECINVIHISRCALASGWSSQPTVGHTARATMASCAIMKHSRLGAVQDTKRD